MGGKSIVPGRGRKPKPSARKKLAGNPGKRKINNAEPDFSELTYVDPPEWLDENATMMWEQAIVELCGAGVLAVTDLHNLEIFCCAYSRWREAEKQLAEDGVTLMDVNTGKKYKHPADTVGNTALRQVATFGSLLGFDPVTRQRLIGGNKEQNSNRFSDF